ncbi:N-hydroxyarylamine O-acetyltransferase [Lipingzhangella halophila]|uniref:N-hydroxyarylamine O-acetyltransferase n=1 Tax=Lipingzhangella halophila TaxID=1783352 RepID=A0A7W7RFA6_9ACTN|nr:arylamine N-acetyltransferase [Lipingzhangella halophila]MBB4930906.1 N-hydroxyarylamine O-acetyltransferase [Lipingzhangella halophila]
MPESTRGPQTVTDPAFGWQSASLDVPAYLKRIGYSGALAPTLETLRALHRAHAATIPFENLDILLGAGIELDLEHLQDKLVRRGRGGYCYEQNLLFAAVLEHAGFRVCGLAARVRMGSDALRPTSHALLDVGVDGASWIADVGFGGEGLLEPIRLSPGTEARQGGWAYRLDEPGRDGTWVLRSRHPDDWFDMYSFTREPHYSVDYEVTNHYTATHPRSPFVRRMVVQRTGPDVRRTLVGLELTTTRPGAEPTRRELAPEEVPDTLSESFGLELDASQRRELVRIAAQAASEA